MGDDFLCLWLAIAGEQYAKLNGPLFSYNHSKVSVKTFLWYLSMFSNISDSSRVYFHFLHSPWFKNGHLSLAYDTRVQCIVLSALAWGFLLSDVFLSTWILFWVCLYESHFFWRGFFCLVLFLSPRHSSSVVLCKKFILTYFSLNKICNWICWGNSCSHQNQLCLGKVMQMRGKNPGHRLSFCCF